MTSITSGVGRSCALLLASALGGQFLASAGTPEPSSGAEKEEGLAPLVKVVTATNAFSYIVGQGTGSGARMVLMGIEITDRSGAGIDVDDAGIPKFVNANDNVDAFVRRIVAKGSYTNNLGQTVLQLFAEIPVSGLKVEDDLYISPPFSEGHLRPEDRKHGISIPGNEMVQAASFPFAVRDLQGNSSKMGNDPGNGSKPERASVAYVGFAESLYRPPIPGPTEDKTGEESESRPN